MAKLYLITNVLTKKRYVGKTHKTIKARWKRHLSDSRNAQGCKALQRAILKYGEGVFTVEQIAEFDPETAKAAEVLFITEFKTKAPNGYNLTNGGDGGAGKRTEKTKRKISERMSKDTPCIKGHTRFSQNNRGHRRCLDCHKDKENARYAEHKHKLLRNIM